MDLLLWFKELVQTDPDLSNIVIHYIYQGKVMVKHFDGNGCHYYSGPYKLKYRPDLKEGQIVAIKSSIPNKTVFDDVTMFSNDYVIISR